MRIVTPIEQIEASVAVADSWLIRTPHNGLDDILMWMLDPIADDPSSGAWVGLTSMETAVRIAESLLWARLWAHETWLARLTAAPEPKLTGLEPSPAGAAERGGASS